MKEKQRGNEIPDLRLFWAFYRVQRLHRCSRDSVRTIPTARKCLEQNVQYHPLCRAVRCVDAHLWMHIFYVQKDVQKRCARCTSFFRFRNRGIGVVPWVPVSRTVVRTLSFILYTPEVYNQDIIDEPLEEGMIRSDFS